MGALLAEMTKKMILSHPIKLNCQIKAERETKISKGVTELLHHCE